MFHLMGSVRIGEVKSCTETISTFHQPEVFGDIKQFLYRTRNLGREGRDHHERDKVLGSWAWLISLSVALSTFGSSNGTFFSGGRVCYIAAREGHMPDILSMAHVRRLTPSPALLFTSAMSLIMIISGSFTSIVNFFSFMAWLFYGMTISGLLYLKIKKPELPRSYKVFIMPKQDAESSENSKIIAIKWALQ